MLLMTRKELAHLTGLFSWEADFIMRNPEFIPRSDLHEPMRVALMVGPKWPQEGYGDECTKERLLWYASKGYSGITAEKVEKWTPEIRAAVLEMLEEERRDDLKRGSK